MSWRAKPSISVPSTSTRPAGGRFTWTAALWCSRTLTNSSRVIRITGRRANAHTPAEPAAVEAAGLRNDLLAADGAAINLGGHHHRARWRSAAKPGWGLQLAPRGFRRDPRVGHQVVAGCRGLPAHTTTSPIRSKDPLVERRGGGRWMHALNNSWREEGGHARRGRRRGTVPCPR